MKKILFTIFSLTLILSCKDDVEEQIIETNKTTSIKSSFQEKDNKVIINNNFYSYVSYEENNESKNVILRINKTEEIDKTTNVNHSVINIKPVNNKLNWNIRSKSNSYKIENKTIITTENSNSEFEETYSLYNLVSGKHIMDYTYDKISVVISGGNYTRNVGFVSRSNSKGLLDDFDSNVVGLVNFSTEDKHLKTFIITSNKKIDKTTPDMEMVKIDNGSMLINNNKLLLYTDLNESFDEKDLNYAFGLTYYIGENAEETAIMFVFKNGELLLENTKYDSNIFQISEM